MSGEPGDGSSETNGSLGTHDAAQTVAVSFSLALGEGSLRATVDVPVGPTNLTAILPVLRSLDDSIIAGIVGQVEAAGRQISCKAGCGACCRQMVPLSIFEAEALAAWMDTLPEEKQHELAARFDAALRTLAAAGLIDRMVQGDWLAETEAARQTALDYLAVRVPCPFLENESCSIHPIRPLICREYLVTSDPAHCWSPSTMQVHPVALPVNLSRSLNRLGAAAEGGARGWIPLLFLLAWKQAGAKPGERVGGDGPAVLYEFVQNIRPTVNPAGG